MIPLAKKRLASWLTAPSATSSLERYKPINHHCFSIRESIPAVKSVIEETISGWFVAKVLGQLDSDPSDTAFSMATPG